MKIFFFSFQERYLEVNDHFQFIRLTEKLKSNEKQIDSVR